MRVLIAGFQHETNTFAHTKASYENFILGEGYPPLCRRFDIFSLRNINIPIGGFIQVMESTGHTLIPTIWAAACPSAHVTKDAYEKIVTEIVLAAQSNSMDAIYLDLHGAMIAEHTDDGEGELLGRLREVVGYNIPIIVTLDLHANVTQRMLELADGMIAYRTYPHIDMAETGKRAANFLLTLFKNQKKIYYASRRLPFLIPINAMCTLTEPAQGIYKQLLSLENNAIISLSFAQGFPASDFPECGPRLWGYGYQQNEVTKIIDSLYDELIKREAEWAIQFYEAEQAVREAQKIAASATRPVVIADTQDNPGAGGESNTMGMMRALLNCQAQDAAIGLIYDPEAAKCAHRAGVGAEITLALGGQAGSDDNPPLLATFTVEHLSDGKCRFDGPMFHGMIVELGLVACLKIDRIQIIVSSVKAQMLDKNLYRIGGVDPEKMKILVNKSSVHFRADFQSISETILIAKSPGKFLADPSELHWKNLDSNIRIKPTR